MAEPLTSVRRPAWEVVAVLALVAAFIGGLPPVLAKISPPLLDEVCYTDPGMNLASGDGFVARTWYSQTDTEFWAGNTPLYSALMGIWFTAFPYILMSARIPSVLLYCAAVLVIWATVRRTGWVASPGWRFALVVVLLFSHGGCNTWRVARPDSLGLLLLSLLVATGTRPGGTARVAAVAVGALVPATGLQFVAAAGVAGVLLALLVKPARGPVLAAFVGFAVGGAALWALYHHHGVWDTFLKSTLGTHGTGKYRFLSGYKDPAYWCFLAVGAMGVALGGRTRPALVGLLLGVAIPAALAVASKYPAYYSALGLVPAVVGGCAALAAARLTPLARTAAVAAVVVAVLTGVPLRGILIAETLAFRDPAPIAALANEVVKRDDVAYACDNAFFAVRVRAAKTFGAFAAPPDSRVPPLTLLVLRDGSELPPGRWREVGRTNIPESHLSLISAWLLRLSSDRLDNVVAYRPASPP